ncbi:flagellar filament capping protein FliD [Brevibacillus sp. AF8]|uniref:flagellar filament capping protein FliD n=1 Tax=Brevibacillus sp. AF8 TaxID=2825881 RepID=UPI001E550FB2|nr:flagellar filament capping protein FliD [Brevibacillus sp. AF8]MCE0453099.1 flagellar filament capping protein FliD [Brevibacillus sp. AF8]
MGIRLSGMASGMDTEKIIKDLMKAQREPVNRLQRTKYSTEWKRDAYREMNTVFADFQNSVKNLRLSSSFNKKVATSENDSIASVKVVGQTSLSSYTIEIENPAVVGKPATAAFTSTLPDTKTAIGSTFDLTLKKDSSAASTVVKIEDKDTIETIIGKINNSNSGVKATYFNNQFVLSSDDGSNFTVQAPAGNSLGLKDATATKTDGTPASFKINGVSYTSDKNTITFDGMEISLKQANKNAPITINTKSDEDTIYNMVKDFVDKYNAVLETVNKKISEPKYKGYQPLLDEEKEALPEKTAEKMDLMAKSGILLRDPILSSALSELRRATSTPLQIDGVNKAFDTLSEIGIGGPPSGKNAYQENGKLFINETKLREAIRNNGEDVMKLFTSFSNEKNDLGKKYNESGVAERLYGQLSEVMDKIKIEAGSSGSIYDDSYLSKKIEQTNKDIDRWEDRLKMIENRYWKQFSSMEKAMSKSQSQGSWFAQMLGQR